MAKLTTAQLNAVITTIRNTVSENNEKKKERVKKQPNNIFFFIMQCHLYIYCSSSREGSFRIGTGTIPIQQGLCTAKNRTVIGSYNWPITPWVL